MPFHVKLTDVSYLTTTKQQAAEKGLAQPSPDLLHTKENSSRVVRCKTILTKTKRDQDQKDPDANPTALEEATLGTGIEVANTYELKQE